MEQKNSVSSQQVIVDVAGAIESTMNAHGPRLNKKNTGSAAKRIYGALKGKFAHNQLKRSTIISAIAQILSAYIDGNGPIRRCRTSKPDASHIEAAKHLIVAYDYLDPRDISNQ